MANFMTEPVIDIIGLFFSEPRIQQNNFHNFTP
jgi:hypothetical protein